LKTLIVIHRTLREGDPTFREEMLNYSHRGHILQISNFKDDSSPLGKLLAKDDTDTVMLLCSSSMSTFRQCIWSTHVSQMFRFFFL